VRGQAALSPRPGERGSAVLIVLVLIAVMVIVSMSNVDTLDALKKEIQLIDRQQQQRYEQSQGH
jgi:type II secretory pathway component PulK